MATAFSALLYAAILGSEAIDPASTNGTKTGSPPVKHAVRLNFSEGSLETSLPAGSTVPTHIDRLWSSRRTLTTSTNEDIDLRGGLTDSFGNAVDFVNVVAIMIVNRNTAAGEDLTWAPASSNGVSGIFSGTTPRQTIPSRGMVLWVDQNGLPLSAGSTDKINVANGTGVSITYDIIVLGRS